MSFSLTGGAIQAIVVGDECDKPVLQLISSRKITSAGASNDRYRVILSDGQFSYSHVMLATQLNSMMEEEIDNLCIIRLDKYMCNTLQENRRVIILLGVSVLAKGTEINDRIGDPQAYKVGEANTGGGGGGQANGGSNQTQAKPNSSAAPTSRPAASNPYSKPAAGATSGYNIKAGGGPGTPTSNRVHSIASLTPYQNRWKIRARITQKSNIRTWSNSRGEGKLFSVNLLDESGEIRATGFNDAVDKYYNMLEVNKVFFISKATLKTANKQYSSVPNDYEMTFNSDTFIEPCNEDTDLPTMSFDFVKINELDSKQPNSMIDVIGVVKGVAEVTTVTGKASQKEVSKRDIQLVDQSGMMINLTLWGSEAETFESSGSPIVAVKGCRLSDWGGRSLSVLASSQLILNPDIREGHLLRGWYDTEGTQMDFTGYQRSEGGGTGGSATNWKTFLQVKTENIGQADKAEYFTSKGTVSFMRKENCMYQACPSKDCNKKVVDQGNGMYRCEKCNKEHSSFKYRLILSANLADHTDNQWVTCFQESAEALLGQSAEELGNLRESNEMAFEQVFQDAIFKSYIFRLRAKTETYNEESRLKTVCLEAKQLNWLEYGQRMIDDINKMISA